MNKIINGKLYDTETAKKVGCYDNGYDCENFHYFYEALYLKKTGEWFLYGEGGPMSDYSEPYGSGWMGIRKIMPYTEAEAKRWAARHLNADKYMEHFGKVDE